MLVAIVDHCMSDSKFDVRTNYAEDGKQLSDKVVEIILTYANSSR